MKKNQFLRTAPLSWLTATVCAMVMAPAWSGKLSAHISHAHNDQGEVRCGLFNNPEGWRKEDQALRTIAAPLQGGKAVCEFSDVPPGEYAVAVFHAEQGETKVAYGFLGQPKQGVGFTNNPSITFGAPGFETALVKVGDEPLVVSIELKY